MTTTEDAPATPLMRAAEVEGAQVTNIELFFDLVFVFTVTQLSHSLLGHEERASVHGALQTLVLFGLAWLAWIYTTWVTNWLDPGRLPVRAMLLAVMLASLLFSAAIPDAFGQRGWLLAGAWAAMQVGRGAFAAWSLRGHNLGANFNRITVWSSASGVVVLLGAAAHGDVRLLVWAVAVLIDLVGGAVGFATPGLGRSTTRDWQISGAHISERCQAFVIIALGESVVAIGAAASDLHPIAAAQVIALLTAFFGVAALWWIYFARAADAGTEVIEDSDDPGRLGRSAFHLIHPVIIGGIIVTAAADQRLIDHPHVVGDASSSWLILGGIALFLSGHAMFKRAVWHVTSVSRIGGVLALSLLGLVAPVVSALTLAVAASGVITGVIVADLVRAGARGPHDRH